MNNNIVKQVCTKLLAFSLAVILVFCTGGMQAEAKKVRGRYPTRKGQILVTSDWIYRLIPTGHAAIVYDKEHVIEAQSAGIVWGKNDWMKNRREVYGLDVKRTSAQEDARAADWCRDQLGKPYNYNYLNKKTRDKFYCSQLVWAAYYDLYDIDLSTFDWRPGTWTTAVHPMELVKSKYTKTIFYYSK